MTENTGNPETELSPGLIGRREVLVCEHNVAPHITKLSTPSMIRAMEQASQRAVLNHLPPEQSTVGFEVNVRHVAGADIGATVVAVAELERIDGRWLYFKVEALDGDRTIGVGTHRRAIITLPPEATNRGGGDDSHTHEL
jgi:predicted thioesterase